ncbi:MAG: sulfatase-like hydrolase/transferase, partial [Oscillospiraceae bacterium]
YIKGLLTQWDKHPLFSIPTVDLSQKASLETKATIRQEYTNIIGQWQDKCGGLARKNIHLPIKYLINLFNSEDVDLRSRLGKIKAVAKTLGKLHRGNSLKDNALENYGKEKACVSAQSQLQFFEEKILEMDRENKKYYTYIHLEDFHLPSTFFTYDTDDLDLVRSELADGQSYIDGLPSNYDGNIESDLSVRYLDRKLEKFVNNILGTVKNEVVFVVTADHGNPFYHKPIRPNWRNVCYENFTIPFIMFGNGVPNIQCGRATSSVDIIPTILYYSGNEIGKDYTGQVIGSDNFVLKPVGAEYMGAGCPDYTRREICYSMMNENYKVGVKVLLAEDVTPQNIDEIYNLKKDNGLDLYNLYKKERGNPEVQQLLEEISKRHKEIQKALAVN